MTTIRNEKEKVHDFRADVPTTKMPVIVSQRFDEYGERFYFSVEGKMFHADTFDRIWSIPKLEVRGKYYKGTNPRKMTAILHNQI